VQDDWLSLTVDAVLALLALFYLRRVQRLGGRGRHWPRARTVDFLGGLVCIWIAVGSGLAAYDNVNPSAHVVQHVLLMMVAAPLLVAGQPAVLLAQASSRSLQRTVVRATGSRAAALFTGPTAWLVYYVSMPVYFLTGLYALSVRISAFHDACHGWFLLVGCLFWSGIVGPEGRRGRRSPAARLAWVIAGFPVELALGLALLVWPYPLAPGNTLAATHAAGVVFWVASMAISGVALIYLFHRWMVDDERHALRVDRRLEAVLASQAGDR
jgi:putative copper resistance protein D